MNLNNQKTRPRSGQVIPGKIKCPIFISITFLLSFFLLSCSNENSRTAEEIIQASLDAVGPKAAREKIQNLVSLADCVSPNGKYTTEIHTARGGYSYFKQVYGYRPVPFEAIIENKTNGFVIGDLIEGLSKEAIGAIRGHEFHNLVLEVDQRFHEFGKPEIISTGQSKVYQVKATDELNNDCSIFFDKKSGLLSAIHFQNPDSTNEVITTQFSDWKVVEGLLLPHHVDIDQSGKQYTFDFIRITFNSPVFQYRNVNPEK